ncbi:MAG TPA: hypothetical protein VFI24_14015 [Pyrinomonadaceae bacterium]|nr:hypothetical protein [Pyrinomonadaceae bacterium]
MKNGYCLGCKRDVWKLQVVFLLAVLIPLSACARARSVQGKWVTDFVSKSTGEGAKVVFEFLPDGTFNAMPLGDTIIVDKDKYELLKDGHTLKIRSQLLSGDAVCQFTGDAIQCGTEFAKINFKRLS